MGSIAWWYLSIIRAIRWCEILCRGRRFNSKYIVSTGALFFEYVIVITTLFWSKHRGNIWVRSCCITPNFHTNSEIWVYKWIDPFLSLKKRRFGFVDNPGVSLAAGGITAYINYSAGYFFVYPSLQNVIIFFSQMNHFFVCL